VCHRVQLGASLRACSVVYLRTYSEVYLGAYSELYLGAYSECTRERLESLLGSVEPSRLGVCHRVPLEASLRACSGVYLRTYSELHLGAYSECTRERLESLLGSVRQAGWECTIKCNQERTSERTWERAMKCIWQFSFKFVKCSRCIVSSG